MGPIVGIGEILWDIFPDGRKVLGGAPFNFAFHCHQLGHEAVIVSRVGDDDLGREIRDRVKSIGMSDVYIQTDFEHPTGTVKVTVDEKGQPSYEIVEDVAWDFLEWTESISKLRSTLKACCFGSLGSRSTVSRETIAWFVGCRDSFDAELIVCDLNIRPGSYLWKNCLQECHWLKVNEAELQMLVPGLCGDIQKDYGYWIRHRWTGPTFIVTLGERGSFIANSALGFEADASNDLFEPAVPAKVVDTVGAGDAFTAAMVLMHLEGRPLRECARFANHYAARVCEHRGATPVINRRDVELAAFGK